MAFKRFQNEKPLTKQEKVELLAEYIEYYKKLINEKGVNELNVKIPRDVFEPVIDKVGEILIKASIETSINGQVKEFLDNNKLPPHMRELLPDEFRAFSLLLNALKQWVSAESAATDRFLLGGTARQTCRSITNACIVTGEPIGPDAELHHPVRDGRPPILLSKKGHTMIEQHNQQPNQTGRGGEDGGAELWETIKNIRTEKHMSWVQLREGCNAIMTGSNNCRQGAKSFANKIIRETGLSAENIIILLNSNKV